MLGGIGARAHRGSVPIISETDSLINVSQISLNDVIYNSIHSHRIYKWSLYYSKCIEYRHLWMFRAPSEAMRVVAGTGDLAAPRQVAAAT